MVFLFRREMEWLCKKVKPWKFDDRGSATVEAALAVPIFIFAVLGLYFMGQCKLAETSVYEAAVETSEYLAEYAYFSTPNQLLAAYKFPGYLDDKELVGKYVVGGVKGVDFMGSVFDGEYIKLQVNYKVGINLPFISKLTSKKTIYIKQKYYKGSDVNFECDTSGEEKSEYVFVTDNREVYHNKRSCTHLELSISKTSLGSAKKNGYVSCERCGNIKCDTVYITDSGGKYHSNIYCSGLKRTVHRVDKSEIGELAGCTRCAE